MNRGAARRTLFENRQDIRFFLSRVAREVRKGRLEVHAYAVLTTHFHLLVRSPRGELSAALQALTNEYVRWFNRRRRRDGSLVRGRFLSKPVESLRYRVTLVRYIDDNPVAAGLSPSPQLYPYCSARFHAQDRGPRWLARAWIVEHLRSTAVAGRPPRDYADVFGSTIAAHLHWLVERRLAQVEHGDDPLDELVGSTSASIRDWMRRKAALADGTRPGLPVAAPEEIEHAVASHADALGAWRVKLRRKSVDGWILATIGLLRDLSGTTLRETAVRCGRSFQNTAALSRIHRRLLLENATYANRIASIAHSFLSE